MSTAKKLSVGQRLRHERERLNWSQEQLAEKIGSTTLSINRWEHDKTLPRSYYRAELCRVFNKGAEELFDLHSHTAEEGPVPELPTIWNVPHLRNLYFTGREEVLKYLHTTLTAMKTVALIQPHAISGLGGIGKTQTAVEYTYRYRSQYKAVLWARADFQKSLISDFVTFADLLHLAEKDEADQNRVVAAVMRWLQTHTQWLLILDNADDLEMVYNFLPMRGGGHTLLTTRSQITGPNVKGVELEKMGREEGALLLLQRAKMLAEDAPLGSVPELQRHEAEAICELVDGLPLALDQVAGYVEEHQCSFADYLGLYQTHRAELLKRRGTFGKRDYPKSVGVTWLVSFGQVQQTSPAAADLLRFCAFLHPDAIPEEMIVAGAADLGPHLQAIAHDSLLLNDAIATLRTYSLVRRNSETKMLTIHRLVQTVLKDTMSRETQKEWAERVVRVVNRVFPNDPIQMQLWPMYQQYLSHARACAMHIEQWNIVLPEAARLLHATGNYLHVRGQYTQETERFYQRALAIREQVFGSVHPEVAPILNDLGLLYKYQDKDEQAEQFYSRALSAYEQTLGPDHPDVADTLNNLAWLYRSRGAYEQAEALMQRTLAIAEHTLASNPARAADYLNNLAKFYLVQSKYEQAAPLIERALALREQVLDPTDPDVANSLATLAKLSHAQSKDEQAELLYERALSIYEQSLGPIHSHVAGVLEDWALLYRDQGRYEQAIPLLQRALSIYEQSLGLEHSHVADVLEAYADVLRKMGREGEAVSLEQRVQAIRAGLA